MDLSSIGNESARFFGAMLQLSNSPILITDAKAHDNPIVLVNPAFEKATGYRSEEVIGRNCRFLQNDDRQQPGIAVLAAAIRAHAPCEVQLRNYRKDGQPFWTRIYMFPVTDVHGDVTHYVGIQHDMTAETAVLDMLREKQVFIDASPDVYLKVATDLTIVEVNRACEALSGWHAGELVGTSAAALVSPDRLAGAQQKIRMLLAQDHPSRFNAEYASKAGALITIEWNAVRNEARDAVLFVGRDITAKQKAEREAMRANTRVASILASINEACLSLDQNWHCTYVNGKAAEWFGIPAQDLVGKNVWGTFRQALGSVFHITSLQAMRTKQFAQCEAYYPPVDRWLEARAYPSDDGLTIFLLDISERKKNELALLYSATHDTLTGLPNRNACLRTLTQQLGADAAPGNSVAAVFIDLDHFKEVNDGFGHAAGDKVLEEIGYRLLGFAGDACYPARISGDEFVVILFDTDEHRARMLAAQILDSIAAPIAIEGHAITIGASIGIALARGAAMTADDLINQADTAMYASKSNGRHVITVFDSEVNNWDLRRHRLRQDMLLALRQGEFVLHYQPQVSSYGNRVVGAEALIRWQHPEFGLLAPAAFLEIAEESPLIIEMGKWVFDEACRQLRIWQDSGYRITMSINVSPRQLANRGMPETMLETVERHGVNVSCLKLEVTESMLAQDFDAMAQVLAGLKEAGFRIALDDFGTGYSNLSYIGRLPVSAIKIDRSFVTGLAVDQAALPLVKGIVALAKSLGLYVICEGVETVEQREMLASARCDSLQGYLISRPVSADDFYARFLALN